MFEFPRRGRVVAGRACATWPTPATATTVYVADALQKPLLVEGPAGVGKTQLAKAVAEATGAELIRLQCYEGLDEARALYEWNYRSSCCASRPRASERRRPGKRPTTTSSPTSSCSPARC